MRLRNIPRAEGVIQMHRTVIKRPEDQRGCWHQVFGDRHPIYIEIGMGKGQFILNMAKAHPDVNFIGIERYSSVLLRALEKFDTEEYEALTNIRFVCMDARNVEEVFAPEEVDKIFLNFSDPWPKARHAKRRLTSTEFLERYEKILARYGHECHAMGLLNTDWGDYGHINHPDFSRIGMIYGAAFSWNADILPEEEINRQISVLEFGDASGKLVSVLDLLCHQDAYPWRTAVMVQEALELHQDKEEAAELLRSCAEGDADAANASIDALCAVLYEKAGTVRPENRPMIYAYLLAADGLKVLNRLLPFLRASLLSDGTLPEKEDCFALAGDLERWLHSYKELWRTVSKESELYRIAHVFCWYADLLRDLNA